MTNYERDYYNERLTDSEANFMAIAPHRCSSTELELRRTINAKQVVIDHRWGFFDYDWWAACKRLVYKMFVHRFIRMRKLPLIESIPEPPDDYYDDEHEDEL